MEEAHVRTSRSVAERAITAVVTSAPAMAIKRTLRDVRWTFIRSGPSNPPLPAHVESILFVCLGNICRSPFAGGLASRKLSEADRFDIRCASAGIRTHQAGRPPEAARAAARAYGLSLEEHRPLQLTRELVDRHDLIVVMEVRQFEELRRTYPDAASRVVLLSLFDPASRQGYERYHIADPFLQPQPVFEACYRRIDRAVTNLLERVGGNRAHSGGDGPSIARSGSGGPQ